MKTKYGFSTLTSILCIAGASAIALAGYTTFTGKTLCSAVAGCDGKSTKETAKAMPVASKEASEGKGCCALAKMAKAASIKSAECADFKAATCKSMNVQARNLQAVVLGSTYPVAIPAAFYDRSATMDCSSLKAAVCCKGGAKAGAINASSTEKSGCCKSGAKAVDASAKSEGCCKSKKEAAATAINASAIEAADEGCCKGSGKRADGKACCGKCPGKTAEKVADSTN